MLNPYPVTVPVSTQGYVNLTTHLHLVLLLGALFTCPLQAISRSIGHKGIGFIHEVISLEIGR